ncbi:DUF4402 domain-containing protein [Novosphingobium sp. Chol11]|uniref:DUF4402 domain-containing protein n=1 Tax=Novosphingobium sp. Chol11 TaxID=1385763 RepID=UPI0025DFEE9A|nr:DUF4402 domain-containing protein [Novosphingobium sp. Chol11]
MIRAAVLAGLIAASFVPVAAWAASAQGQAEATIIEPLVVTRLSDLDFGTVTLAPGTTGSVTIDPASGVRFGGGASAACLSGGDGCAVAHASRFAVRGEAGRDYAVSAPAGLMASGTLLDGSPGIAPDLAIASIRVRTHSRPNSGVSGTLDGNGRDIFDIGGALIVPAGTPAARYRAILPVIVTYS